MSGILELAQLQAEMFIMMGIGLLLRKKNIITDEGKKVLTDLILCLILPCNIIESFCIEFNKNILAAGFTTLLISVGIQLCCSLISAFCYNFAPKRQRVIMRYGTVCSNAGFLGNPLSYCIYGSLGLLYASIYCIPQRIVMWTAGISCFTDAPDTKSVIKKIVTHPCVVACEIGLVLMLTQFQLPEVIGNTLSYISRCTTPITMIFTGTLLADIGKGRMLDKSTVLLVSVRLIVLPLLTLVACVLLRLDSLASSVCVLLAAMPVGTTTAILAAKYGGDEDFATKCVFLTTILSMLFLPVWVSVLGIVLPVH